MPRTYTAPARLLSVRATYEESDDELTGQKRTRVVTLNLTVDLDPVESVREGADYETGTAKPDFCHICTAERWWSCANAYADVLAAWTAYREHADALGRLRN